MPRVYEREMSQFRSLANANPYRSAEDNPTGYLDVVAPAARLFKSEDRSVSRNFNQMAHIFDQVDAYHRVTADPVFDRARMLATGADRPVGEWRGLLENRQDRVKALMATDPDSGLRTLGDIDEQIAGEIALEREELESVVERAGPWAGFFGNLTGAVIGAAQDPINLLTLPFAAARGASLLRVMATEAGINIGAETAITAGFTFQYRQEIGDPITTGQAVTNVAAAGLFGAGFAGILKGAGDVAARLLETPAVDRRLSARIRQAVDDGELQLDAEGRGALEAVEELEEVMAQNPHPEQGPKGEALHLERVQQAGDVLERGESAPIEADVVAGRAKPLHEMSRAELEVAAKQIAQSEAQDLIDVFGKEGAKKYTRLTRTASSMDTARADKASIEIAEMEAGLSPAQEKKLFGFGEEGPNAEDAQSVLDRVDRVVDTSSEEDLAQGLQFVVTSLGKVFPGVDIASLPLEQRGAATVLRIGFEEGRAAGLDMDKVSDLTVKMAAARFPDPDDAAFVLSNFLRPREAGTTPPGVQPTRAIADQTRVRDAQAVEVVDEAQAEIARSAEAADVLANDADLQVPTGERLGDGTPETVTAREMTDAAEQRRGAFQALLDCMGGPGG